jgi:hypothetical protein
METDTTPRLVESDKLVQEDDLKRVVMEDFNSARDYVKQNYQGVWEECFKAYNNIRTRRGYSGVADEFVPETFSIVEALKSSIAGTKPKFKYMPLTEEQETDTTVLNSLVDFFWSCNNMTEKLLNWVEDMIVYGNGVFMVSWDANEDKPLIQHIPLSDFFVDPTATHLNRPEEPGYAKYAGYRYLTSLNELKASKTLDDNGDWVPKFKNLENVNLSSDQDDDLDKDRKEKWLGSTLGKRANKEQVEVVVYYTRRKVIMIANRSTVIFEEENPYHREAKTEKTVTVINGQPVEGTREIPEIQGFLPFAILRNYVDSNLFFARGDVEVILPTQEALNDTASQKRDNNAYVLNNMWQIDPRFKHLIDQIESVPGAVIPIPKGALSPIEKQDMSQSADTEIMRLTQQMRTATAADAAVQGVQQQHSRTTATEIQAQLNQASTRFTTKVQTLEDEGFAQLARILYKMIQIFVDTPRAVRIVGKEGVTFKTYKPGTYQGEYEPRVVLESTANAELAAQAQAMQVAAQFSINNPIVNQKAFLRRQYTVLFPDMAKDDIEELLTPPAPPMMGPDGAPIDAALAQDPNTLVTPNASAAIRGEDIQAPTRPNRFTGRPNSPTGQQGGGGADTSPRNQRRPRANQPSTRLSASSTPSLRR